jgi:hypothetical protein
MLRRNRFGIGFGCALLSATAAMPIYADDTTQPVPAPPALMSALDASGIGKPLGDAGISAGGWVEASYTFNLKNSSVGPLPGRVFDDKAQDPTMNQTAIFVEKTVDTKKFDIGFRIEGLYGSDGRFVHANGLDFYGGDSPQVYPENQLDLTQAYVDVGISVGGGLKIRAGKFVTLLGYETINPTNDPLYSHSYMFGFAIPFTHTGVLGIYQVNEAVSVTAGVTRGWEQSLKDNNDMIDFLGQVSWKMNDKLTLIVSGITGPEQTDDNSDYRSVLDVVATYAATDKLSFGFNGDYGYEADAGLDGKDASWYGIAGYTTYKVNDMFAVQGRVEWFEDPDGARGLGTTAWEGTLGLNIKPFPNARYVSGLMFRPEVRYDYANDAIFNGGDDHDQITVGGDVILTF